MKAILKRIEGEFYNLCRVEDLEFIASSDDDMIHNYGVGKLSKQNCDDLFGVVDINKFIIEDSKDTVIYNESYELGFKRAMELYQPKEIEVEIEMEEFESYDENLDIIKKPKLDENGFLLLKKI